MSTLTDRYVWGVLRAVPERQRADLEPEIRALIADAVDARAFTASATGDAPDHAAAERAALTDLGDPEGLAARYADRSLHLVGPGYYLDYRRLLGLVLALVVPIVTIATIAIGLMAGTGLAEVALSGICVGLTVGVYLAAWVTLTFALVERNGARRIRSLGPWTPDRLPSRPSPRRLGAGEVVASLASAVLLVGIIIATQALPFLDPALGTTWFTWFIGVAVLEIAFTIFAYAARRWTWPIAIINAVLGAAFAIPAVWLLEARDLLGPAAEAGMEQVRPGGLAPSVSVVSLLVIVVVAWDAVDGFRRARRNTGGR